MGGCTLCSVITYGCVECEYVWMCEVGAHMGGCRLCSVIMYGCVECEPGCGCLEWEQIWLYVDWEHQWVGVCRLYVECKHVLLYVENMCTVCACADYGSTCVYAVGGHLGV